MEISDLKTRAWKTTSKNNILSAKWSKTWLAMWEPKNLKLKKTFRNVNQRFVPSRFFSRRIGTWFRPMFSFRNPRTRSASFPRENIYAPATRLRVNFVPRCSPRQSVDARIILKYTSRRAKRMNGACISKWLNERRGTSAKCENEEWKRVPSRGYVQATLMRAVYVSLL